VETGVISTAIDKHWKYLAYFQERSRPLVMKASVTQMHLVDVNDTHIHVGRAMEWRCGHCFSDECNGC